MKSIVFILSFLFLVSFAGAQIDIGGKIKDKTQQRIENKTDRTIDKGLDKSEEGVDGVFKKKDKDKDKDKGDTDNGDGSGDGNEDGSSSNNAPKVSDEKPALMSYTKYDFVPGDQILFFEDFSQDAVGDFPALWTTDGTGEIRTLNNFPGNWLYMNGDDAAYCLMKDLVLPENFIVEFDIVAHNEDNDEDGVSFKFNLYSSEKDWLDNHGWPGTAGFYFEPNFYNISAEGYAPDKDFVRMDNDAKTFVNNKLTHYILWVQKRRLRVYCQGQKILDGPTALPEGVSYNRLRFHMWGEQGEHFLSNIKITTAAPDTRSKLLTEGKLISYGIYFDSGKDEVKAESYGALNDIAKVLKENMDVKIKIVGHTDADGDDKSNLDLSKRRAANVKNALVKDFGIDADRIETDGAGESQPIAGNDNPENKSKNRRVEFLKL
ncbi:MAG: hypothetical protein CVU11_07390 [Bacteroidetes bacterium HGW-Bacteroidetes-6]|jgi:outer membrane protein OmpA-like peptidoglycan-associated protein|nr:MAG: hypothetical protein CVU11_07390 [Bacteroidetes bacterium HGW-Bacteroidetes-6]